MILIAEVKIQSPFGYRSTDSWEHLFEIANQIGDFLSIHTDHRWGGSFELLKHARKLTGKPILAKGIHAEDDDILRAIDAGADLVLVVGRIPLSGQTQCIIEPHTLHELTSIPPEFKVIWNSRDLITGAPKHETFEAARAVRKGWLCQASNIKSVKDIKAGANAILVGQHLSALANELR